MGNDKLLPFCQSDIFFAEKILEEVEVDQRQ